MEENESKKPPKFSAVSQHQLAKFQELQRRRLQLKAKTKNQKKSKDKKDKFSSAKVGTQGCVNDHIDENLKDSAVKSSSKGENCEEVTSSSSSHDYVHPAFKKKKLHWGLDTKEWWERKANM